MESNKTPLQRLAIREEKEKPLLDEILKLIEDKLTHGRVLPKSKLRQALYYAHSLSPYLRNYLEHADARLDNNPAERSLRAIAVGRKNWLFFGSDRGAEAGSTLFSLIQTCRHLKINPQEYIEDVMRRIMGHVYNHLEELLPDQ